MTLASTNDLATDLNTDPTADPSTAPPEPMPVDLMVDLARELARVDRRIHAYWAAQQTPASDALLADLPIPRLFPADADALPATQGQPTAPANAHESADGPSMPHLLQLAHDFRLDSFALEALLIILAPALDSHYGRIYGYLQDDLTQRHATVDLVLKLLGPPGLQRLRYLNHFSEQSPLVQYQLIQVEEATTPLVHRGLLPDPTLVAWLLGDYRPTPQWADFFTLSLPQADETDGALTNAVWPEFLAAMHGQNLACLYGEDAIAQEAMVRRLAVEMDTPLLTVDIGGLVAAGAKPTLALRLVLRDACFTGALLHIQNFDPLLRDGALPAVLLEPLLAYAGLIVLTGKRRWQPQGVWRDEAILWQSFDAPSYGERRRLWRFFLEKTQPDCDFDIDSLAGRFRLLGWQIRDVVAGARDQAEHVGRDTLSEDDLTAAVRAYSQTRLVELATRIVPRYTWDDLVLPAAQITILQAVVNMVQQRALVLEDWGVGRKLLSKPAVSVLFAGDPGTGKTLAAEVLASRLGLDLYKIDLSSMVSKYIGETEKNLEAIFREAERSNAILFFDEADAVFGKRSGIRDAHDRYANIGVSYLLQRMESHEGITILATNLRANLDEAFTRRLQFVIDFPFPEPSERLRLWQSLIPPDLPLADDVKLVQLAHQHKLAGGSIRNVIVGTAFMAAEQNSVVTMQLLLEGIRREFQKMGRLSSDGDVRLPNVPPPAMAPVPPPPPRRPNARKAMLRGDS